MSQTAEDKAHAAQERVETDLLGYAYNDGTAIDRAVQAGITPAHFGNPYHHHQWELLCELRMAGKPTDAGSAYQEAVGRGCVDALGGIQYILQCSDLSLAAPGGAEPAINALVQLYAKRESIRRLGHVAEGLRSGSMDLPGAKTVLDEVGGLMAGQQRVSRAVSDVAAEVKADAEARISGQKQEEANIVTGIPTFDRQAGAIGRHEYIVLAGRSSHGKSSLMLQIAGHNLAHGKRVAIFSLETSAKAVVRQLAGQRAGVNLRAIRDELPDKQKRYLKALDWLGASKSVQIYDEDLTLAAIGARCRLLAQSFKPDLVILDYLQLVGGVQGGIYERVSAASKAMIPLQKMLGCTLMAGAQLNQESEKDEREPKRTDFRGGGEILEDSHRSIVIWRIPGQRLDQVTFDCELLQLKNRDGALCKVALEYNAPHTLFREKVIFNN